MTIPASETGITRHVGNGVAATFDYEFKITDKSDLLVTIRNDEGTASVKTVDVDYTVSGVGNSGGGNIVLTSGALPDGYSISIEDNLQLEQATPFRNQSNFFGVTHESAFDKVTRLVRQAKNLASSAIRLPSSVTGVSSELPIPQALRLIRWNSDADALENIQASDLSNTLATSNWVVKDFIDGVDFTSGTTTQLTLDEAPGVIQNSWVFFDGATQHQSEYSISGAVVTFNDPIPAGIKKVEVRVNQALDQGFTDASAVNYTPAGAGALVTNVQAQIRLHDKHLNGSVSVFDYLTQDQIALIKTVGADVTTELQTAITATTAANSGSAAGAFTLEWPAGTYIISSSLTVDGTFNWVGTSKTGVEIKASSGVTEMLSLPDSVIGDTSTTQRSSIAGIRFNGNSIATYAIKGYTNNFTMRDCYINATLTSAIDISYGWSIVYDNVEISNNSGDGITARGQGSNNSVSITHCKIFSNSGVGVIAGSSTNSFTIDSGTTIELNAKGGVLLTNDLRNCTIRDSYFESNANTGYTFTTPAETIKADIIINGGGTDNLSYGTPVVNAVIDGNYVASGGGIAFIYATGMNGGRVSNNTLHNSTASLIATYGNVSGNLTYGQFSNVKIFGNSGFTKKYTGTHDGSNNSATLSDSSASFPVDYLIGSVVKNVTDDSYNLITDNTATTVTASLVGGTDNDWDTGDTYEIVIPELRIMNMPLAGTGAVLYSGSGFAGIEYDEAEKIELTEADFNKWTLVSGSGGTWQRSSTVFDLNPNALVWEIEYLSSGESGRFGFQIDMDDYPNLQGMFGEFVIYAKSPNDPYINTYVNGVSDTPSESTTDWIPYRTIFRFPVKGVVDFSVTKVGASGTVQFACPVVRELGGITKELCDERTEMKYFRGSAAPTVGTWKVGDIVYDTTPSASGNIGWVCVTAGSPGTWKSFGTISA